MTAHRENCIRLISGVVHLLAPSAVCVGGGGYSKGHVSGGVYVVAVVYYQGAVRCAHVPYLHPILLALVSRRVPLHPDALAVRIAVRHKRRVVGAARKVPPATRRTRTGVAVAVTAAAAAMAAVAVAEAQDMG